MLALAIAVPSSARGRTLGSVSDAGLRPRTTVSVAIAEGKHPVPSRTRKLSPPAPMVLLWETGWESRSPPGHRRERAAFGRPVPFRPRTLGARCPRPSTPTRRQGPPSRAARRPTCRATSARRSSASPARPRPATRCRACRARDRAARARRHRARPSPRRRRRSDSRLARPRSARCSASRYYGQERWQEALTELKAYRRMTESRRPEPHHRRLPPRRSGRPAEAVPARRGGAPGQGRPERGQGRGRDRGGVGVGRSGPVRRGTRVPRPRANPRRRRRGLHAAPVVREGRHPGPRRPRATRRPPSSARSCGTTPAAFDAAERLAELG